MSSLHGSQRIYSVEGWEKVPRYYAKQPLTAKRQVAWEVRPANFDDAAEIRRVAAIYDGYARKFNGTFVRDDMAYWTEWVRTESPNAWVAERDGVIEGYVSVVRREARLNVEEFFVSDSVFAEDRGQQFFEELLSNVIAQLDAESLEVIYPAPIADGFNAPTIEEHGSAMYRINQPDALSSSYDSIPNLLHNQPQFLSQGVRSHHISFGIRMGIREFHLGLRQHQ